jgi:site-specific DNA recombinase
MNAAIYARKSTDDKRAGDDPTKSVTRQVENARAFATERGWTVAHVFTDDGISGAEFAKRPAFVAMMAMLPRPPFQFLVVSEQKSIGRESYETNMAVKRLAQAGVEIFEYMHGRSLTPKNALEKVLGSVQGFADEAHREATSERVHEAHAKLHAMGYVTGGRTFGYRNVDVFHGTDAHGRPLRSHVDREIDGAQAQTVRHLFELYTSGLGLKAIAIRLNGEQVPSPPPFVWKDKSKVPPLTQWAPSTVRAILKRDLYHGVVVWNRSKKRDDWGQVDQKPRPELDWMKMEREDLRIVPEELWQRAASRRRDTEGHALRFASGRLSGRPPKHETRNLLAGLASCGTCGGGMVVETSPRKRGRVAEYGCHRHRHNGTCSNKLTVPVAVANEAVLSAIEEHVLTSEAIESVVALSERDEAQDRQVALDREQKDLGRRIDRLNEAIAMGDSPVSLLAKLREYEKRQAEIREEQAGLRPVPRLAPSVIEGRLAEWRRLLRASTTQGRSVLQRVLQGRLVFSPRADGQGYDFEAQTRYDKLFSGVAVARPAFLKEGDVRGTEHLTVNDTNDQDYGRLLERAEKRGKGGSSPTGFEPVFWP